MSRKYHASEDALFDDPMAITSDETDEEEFDAEHQRNVARKAALDEGCVSLGVGSMRRMCPEGYGPDGSEFSSAFD